jgi:hypothetical protein
MSLDRRNAFSCPKPALRCRVVVQGRASRAIGLQVVLCGRNPAPSAPNLRRERHYLYRAACSRAARQEGCLASIAISLTCAPKIRKERMRMQRQLFTIFKTLHLTALLAAPPTRSAAARADASGPIHAYSLVKRSGSCLSSERFSASA